jgi:hypothetical protein
MNRMPLISLLAALAMLALTGIASAASLPAPGAPEYRVPAGKVEHTVTTVVVDGTRAIKSSRRIERWLSHDRARTVITDTRTGKVTREVTHRPGESRVYDGRRNLITVMRSPKLTSPPWNAAAFEAAVQRAYVEQGITTVVAEREVDGRRALVVTSNPAKWRSDDPDTRTSAVVDAETFRLYERTTEHPKGLFSQREVHEVVELLDESGAVRARMAMSRHKGATIKRRSR